MINYFNFKKYKSKYLLTNDFGRYVFLEQNDFKNLLMDKLPQDKDLADKLQAEYFAFDNSIEEFSRLTAFNMYGSKNYLYKSTSLHIFVVTSACNHKCVYCQAQSSNKSQKGFMSIETAKKAVNIALQSPSDYLDFEFQGGEPLLNFDVIKYIVEYSKSVSNKHINYSIVSNLTLLTDEMIEFIKINNISISTSLDGNEIVHNQNRPYRNNQGTYFDVLNAISRLRKENITVGAIQTTTKNSLPYYKEIVDTYINLDLHMIFLRPLTPLGCADENWEKIGYTPEQFVEFYKKALDYIIEVNNKGYHLVEGHSKTFLTKILSGFSPNYMELISPCGAMLGQLAYYYDGKIFTCDEARMLYEMGDDSFYVGNTDDSTYDTIASSKVGSLVAKASVLESLPSCSDCVYQPYCGVCPVVNYAQNNNIYENTPREYKCKIYGGMLDIIFDYLYYNKDIDTFWRWIK